MALDKQTLLELKEKLIQEKTQLREELGRIAKPIKNTNDFNTKFDEIGTGEDENASEIEEYADNLALETNLESQLKDIDIALEKIERGEYGKCEKCGAEISLERLMAYPAAKKCTNC
jgi:DnaK suppressor protein